MKERWKLISTGTERKSIKIANDKLLVDGSVYGKINPTDASSFLYLHAPTPVIANADQTSPWVTDSPTTASPGPCLPVSTDSKQIETSSMLSSAYSTASSPPPPLKSTSVGTVSSQ